MYENIVGVYFVVLYVYSPYMMLIFSLLLVAR